MKRKRNILNFGTIYHKCDWFESNKMVHIWIYSFLCSFIQSEKYRRSWIEFSSVQCFEKFEQDQIKNRINWLDSKVVWFWTRWGINIAMLPNAWFLIWAKTKNMLCVCRIISNLAKKKNRRIFFEIWIMIIVIWTWPSNWIQLMGKWRREIIIRNNLQIAVISVDFSSHWILNMECQ